MPQGGPTAFGKQPFPATANAPLKQPTNPGATPQMGRNPHLGQYPPNGSNLAKKSGTTS